MTANDAVSFALTTAPQAYEQAQAAVVEAKRLDLEANLATAK